MISATSDADCQRIKVSGRCTAKNGFCTVRTVVGVMAHSQNVASSDSDSESRMNCLRTELEMQKLGRLPSYGRLLSFQGACKGEGL